MVNDPAQIQQRIRLGGIKLSPELATFTCTCPAPEPCSLVSVLSAIASDQIPLSYLSLARSPQHSRATFCVEAHHRLAVEAALRSPQAQSRQWYGQGGIGTITLFPHRSSLGLLGQILRELGIKAIPVHGALSSISALSLNTGYSVLDDGVAALSPVIELPENHAPMRQQSLLVNMVETVAVYWEPVIRVYGFDVRKDITLLELTFPIDAMASRGEALVALAADGLSFLQVLVDRLDDNRISLYLVLQAQAAERAISMLQQAAENDPLFTIRPVRHLEMLFFHGPHFQDRYGIAHALFRALDQSQLSLHLVGCTGTSISLVLGAGEAEQARALLVKDFVVP